VKPVAHEVHTELEEHVAHEDGQLAHEVPLTYVPFEQENEHTPLDKVYGEVHNVHADGEEHAAQLDEHELHEFAFESEKAYPEGHAHDPDDKTIPE